MNKLKILLIGPKVYLSRNCLFMCKYLKIYGLGFWGFLFRFLVGFFLGLFWGFFCLGFFFGGGGGVVLGFFSFNVYQFFYVFSFGDFH